jgi:hypothetical protein
LNDLGRARIGVALLLAAVAATAGCETKSRTEIVLGLATDLAAPDPLATVDLEIRRLPDDVAIGSVDLPISGKTGENYEIPASYRVHSEDGSPHQIRVILSARDGKGERLIVRTAVLGLIPERSLFVRLGLVSACRGRFDCATGDTCIDGSCVSEQIDSTRLPDYTAGLENQVSCAGPATYVNTGSKQPLPVMATSCGQGGVCQEGVCLQPPAAGPGSDGGQSPD